MGTYTVGERIRHVRESKKISQFAVAYALDMSQAAYSKIERGETEVKVSHLYTIAAFLKISIYDLLPEAMASGTLDGNEYLLKPLLVKLKQFWYHYRLKYKLRRRRAS